MNFIKNEVANSLSVIRHHKAMIDHWQSVCKHPDNKVRRRYGRMVNYEDVNWWSSFTCQDCQKEWRFDTWEFPTKKLIRNEK